MADAPRPPAPTPPPQRDDAARARPGQAPVLITSDQLFAGASEVQIDHRGSRYRLKQTSLGKLILTK